MGEIKQEPKVKPYISLQIVKETEQGSLIGTKFAGSPKDYVNMFYGLIDRYPIMAKLMQDAIDRKINMLNQKKES